VVHLNLCGIVQQEQGESELLQTAVLNVTTSFVELKQDEQKALHRLSIARFLGTLKRSFWRRTWRAIGSRQTARVKTYGDVLHNYEFHPESKCADADGKPCSKQTSGLLQRRHIRVDQIKYIGKEPNSLEEVESGPIHSEQNVYTEYPEPRRDGSARSKSCTPSPTFCTILVQSWAA
jgi:hypothetical protein